MHTTLRSAPAEEALAEEAPAEEEEAGVVSGAQGEALIGVLPREADLLPFRLKAVVEGSEVGVEVILGEWLSIISFPFVDAFILFDIHDYVCQTYIMYVLCNMRGSGTCRIALYCFL